MKAMCKALVKLANIACQTFSFVSFKDNNVIADLGLNNSVWHAVLANFAKPNRACFLLSYCRKIDLWVLGQTPPDINPQTKTPLDKSPPCQNPSRQNILFRNFITFVFRMSYRKEISIWFLAVKYIRHGSIK